MSIFSGGGGMLLGEFRIEHKNIEAILVAFIRFNLKERGEIHATLQELVLVVPPETIAGAPYVNIQFFSSYTEGFEAEVGFPVTQPVEGGRVKSKTASPLEVLSLTHHGPPEALLETRAKLREYTSQHALISGEFTREVYPEWQNPQGPIEVQFVIHNWNAIFARNLERVLGKTQREAVMQGADSLNLESTPEDRFQWAKAAMQRLGDLADEQQKYDAVSSCAHVYPPGQLEKLKHVFDEVRGQADDPLKAVDAVRDFMKADPGWNEREQYRVGRVIYHTKNPFDPQAYAEAQTADEKRAAYCFCPIIRNNLDKGMPVTYCYCGSGWYRQQWETATGKPVTVEVVQSVLKGDSVCQFAVHLPENL
jgi:effector-binding domain-containing protein